MNVGRWSITTVAVGLMVCGHTSASAAPQGPKRPKFRLPAQKAGFETKVGADNEAKRRPPKPPRGVFELVRYPAPLGKNPAYITPVKKGSKRPAIVWIHGGFNFGIGPMAWAEAPLHNDQTASVFRDKGLVLMLPSLRGTNDSPGRRECFFGEVEDVIAAGRYLATRPDVDPERIYLGGHSTGGTLALLVAESTDFFKAIFSFGPVLDVRAYDGGCLDIGAPFQEAVARAPAYYLADIVTPTYIIEGAARGNGPYDIAAESSSKLPVSVLMVPGTNHFSVLRPGSEIVADAILKAKRNASKISISAGAIAKLAREKKASLLQLAVDVTAVRDELRKGIEACLAKPGVVRPQGIIVWRDLEVEIQFAPVAAAASPVGKCIASAVRGWSGASTLSPRPLVIKF